MTETRPLTTTHKASFLRPLVMYGVVLAAIMAAFHILVAVRSADQVNQWGLLILGAAAVIVFVGVALMRTNLMRNPYGLFVFHVVSYLIIVGSVSVHEFLDSRPGGLGSGLVWMVLVWTIGLLVHAYASAAYRGFADVDA